MALSMHYTDSAGNTYSSSYWRVTFTSFQRASKTGYVILEGYKDGQARTENKRPIDSFCLNVSESQYTEWFSPSVLDAPGKNEVSKAYLLAKTTDFFALASDVLDGMTPESIK